MKKLFMPVFTVLLSLFCFGSFAADPAVAIAAVGQPAVFVESVADVAPSVAANPAPVIPGGPDMSIVDDLVGSLGLSPDSLIAKVIFWVFLIVGAATALLRLLVLITGVTPNTKDDQYVARAARWLSIIMSLLDRFVAWGLPADKARQR